MPMDRSILATWRDVTCPRIFMYVTSGAQKRDIKFVCGSDEHGVPITIRAMKEGITPQEVVDKYHAIIKDSFEKMGISFDIYSRTSNKVHHETVSGFFQKPV